MKNCCTRFLYVLLFLAALPLVAAPLAEAEQACRVCNMRHNGSCLSQCKQDAECHATCMDARCGSACGQTSAGAGAEESAAAENAPKETRKRRRGSKCKSCIQYKEHNECPGLCTDADNRKECITKCAARECSSKCKLPGAAVDPSRQTGPRQTCRECERSATRVCKKKCGDDQGRAGFVACEVSCVEEKCLKPCNPTLF